MKASLNQNYSTVNFRGKTPDIDDLKKIRKFVNCGIDSLADNLTREVKAKIPKAIEEVQGIELPKKIGFFRNAIEGVRDLFELPFDLFEDFISRFSNSKIADSSILQWYKKHALKENQHKALQGLYEDGTKFINEFAKDKLAKISTQKDNCGDLCREVCNSFVGKFNALLNKSMDFDRAVYDTKKERFITRLVSGFTAAVFLGNDFFNSAKLKGKTDEEAKKSQRLKQGQEIKENILEGLMQFGLLSCFSSFVNSNLWASALFGTAISLVSRIISRKSSGMRLTRADVPEYSMKEFQKSIKENKKCKTQSEMDKEAKKPILSLKNILLFCGISVAAGFTLRALGLHTDLGKRISKFIQDYSKKFKAKMTSSVVVTDNDVKKVADILSAAGEDALASSIRYDFMNNESFFVGRTQKTYKLFGKIEVSSAELKKLPLAPFRIIKEVISYPYKIAKNLAAATGIIDNNANCEMVSPENAMKELREVLIPSFVEKIKITEPIKRSELNKIMDDPYNIRNLFLRFKQFENKYGANSDKLTQEFADYIKKMRLASLNNKTVSKVDNSKIAIIAQTTGTLTGMWFNMNDEFNAAIKNGSNKQDAEVAARKRGLNKFARMSCQVAISGALNSLFKRQYQGSMIGAGLIVALSTFLTDIVSRQMTAMPTKKMNKEELEKYQKNHKEGFMSWYYNLIDKLAK